MSMYLEAACPILGPIVMALVKLEGFQMDAHNVKEQSTRVPSFLPLLCSKVKTSHRPTTDQLLVTSTQQKSLITKLSITSYLCGFYVKQSHGTVLKTRIFALPFTTVNLDRLCLNGNGLQPLGVSYIWTYKRQCSIAWKYVTLFISKSFDWDLLIVFQQATNSKFTLIHDVWTTKGNRFGFIGASVSFINNDWNYIVQHLSIKLIVWHHKGSLWWSQ